MADQFWTAHAYEPGEPDRVVLFVALHASRDGAPVFGKEWVLDSQGNRDGTAMAQLVSIPVAMAVESVLAGQFAPGVHAAPRDPVLVGQWLAEVGRIADHMANGHPPGGARTPPAGPGPQPRPQTVTKPVPSNWVSVPSEMSCSNPCSDSSPASTAAATNGNVIRFSSEISTACRSSAGTC